MLIKTWISNHTHYKVWYEITYTFPNFNSATVEIWEWLSELHPLQIQIQNKGRNGKSSWWRHQMESFSALLALCAGNSPVPVNSPHKGQWREALMFSLICAWINGWENNREAGDLRRYRAHYDVIVMVMHFCGLKFVAILFSCVECQIWQNPVIF